MENEMTIGDLKTNRMSQAEARRLGYTKITSGYSSKSELWMLQNAAADLDRGGIDWCVVKVDGYVYLGRKGVKHLESFDDEDMTDGWDLK